MVISPGPRHRLGETGPKSSIALWERSVTESGDPESRFGTVSERSLQVTFSIENQSKINRKTGLNLGTQLVWKKTRFRSTFSIENGPQTDWKPIEKWPRLETPFNWKNTFFQSGHETSIQTSPNPNIGAPQFHTAVSDRRRDRLPRGCGGNYSGLPISWWVKNFCARQDLLSASLHDS